MSALTIGGALGLAEGIRNIPQGAPGKIRLNAMLNGVTRRGPFLGNSAGVVAMLYNGRRNKYGLAWIILTVGHRNQLYHWALQREA